MSAVDWVLAFALIYGTLVTVGFVIVQAENQRLVERVRMMRRNVRTLTTVAGEANADAEDHLTSLNLLLAEIEARTGA